MQTIKSYAAQSNDTALAPWTLERRNPKPHDVQIEILFCGVCHSDLHFAKNDWGMTIYPVVPGHEIVGRVTAVGDHVKKFKVGQLAGIGCLVDSCRVCDNCKGGQEQYCSGGAVFSYNGSEKDGSGNTYGGYSKMILCHEDFVLHISDKQPLEAIAPLLCAGITTYSPLRHWNVGKGTKVGIVGLGGLGHMAVKLAVSMGAEVTMLSHTAAKATDAERLGAHKFVLTTDEEQAKSVANYFDFILDTVSAVHDYNFYPCSLAHSSLSQNGNVSLAISRIAALVSVKPNKPPQCAMLATRANITFNSDSPSSGLLVCSGVMGSTLYQSRYANDQSPLSIGLLHSGLSIDLLLS